MSRRLVIRPEVEAELNDAVYWYRQRTIGVAERFLRAFDETLARIDENPFQFQIIDIDIRHAVMRRFPYSVMFSVDDENITIFSCFHDRRNPVPWHKRSPP